MSEVSHVFAPLSSATARLAAFLAEVARPDVPRMAFDAFERRLQALLADVGREETARELARHDLDVPVVELDGVRHRRVLRCEATYLTRAGTVTVERTLYANRSADGAAICPLELRAGIVEGFWTPEAAKVAAWSVVHLTPGDAETLFQRLGGMTPSKSSLDRLPKGLSTRWESQRDTFEAALRVPERIPASAVAVSVSLDGVMTPMKDGDRAGKRATAKAAGKETRGPAGYQEVGCGTLSFFDAEGERLSTIQVVRMPEKKKATLKEILSAELAAVRTARPDLTVVKVADAAPDNWTFLDRLAPDGEAVLDFFHAAQHLSYATDAAYGEGSVQSKGYAHTLRHRLREPGGADKVIRALRYLHKRYPRREVIARELAFFRKNKHRMDYATLEGRKLPIGSGIVEAACKTLVTQRLKRSGMRWRTKGGQAVLTLRALDLSGRFDRAWEILTATYAHDVKPANNHDYHQDSSAHMRMSG